MSRNAVGVATVSDPGCSSAGRFAKYFSISFVVLSRLEFTSPFNVSSTIRFSTLAAHFGSVLRSGVFRYGSDCTVIPRWDCPAADSRSRVRLVDLPLASADWALSHSSFE